MEPRVRIAYVNRRTGETGDGDWRPAERRWELVKYVEEEARKGTWTRVTCHLEVDEASNDDHE